MGGSNEEYEVNHQTYCGSMERWIFKPHDGGFIDGVYRILNTKWDKLFINYHDAVVKAANDEDLWVIRRVEGNTYTLQSRRTGRYLIAHGDRTVSTEEGEDASGSHWLVTEHADGIFCFQSTDVNQWLRVRNSGDDYHIELNEIRRCGEWARWTLDRVNNPGDVFEGSYIISNNKQQRYLSNTLGDEVVGDEYAHIWKVTRESENVFSLQAETTANYLRCGSNQGEVNAVGHNLAWERWIITVESNGDYCI